MIYSAYEHILNLIGWFSQNDSFAVKRLLTGTSQQRIPYDNENAFSLLREYDWNVYSIEGMFESRRI